MQTTVLAKGTIVKVDGCPLELMSDVEVSGGVGIFEANAQIAALLGQDGEPPIKASGKVDEIKGDA